jgi:hypothetical protein
MAPARTLAGHSWVTEQRDPNGEAGETCRNVAQSNGGKRSRRDSRVQRREDHRIVLSFCNLAVATVEVPLDSTVAPGPAEFGTE